MLNKFSKFDTNSNNNGVQAMIYWVSEFQSKREIQYIRHIFETPGLGGERPPLAQEAQIV